MAGKTNYERENSRRLSALLTVLLEPWVTERLGELAYQNRTSRSEYVRNLIMTVIDSGSEIAMPARQQTEKLSENLSVPMEPAMMQKLGELARSQHVSKSAFCRLIIVAAIEPTASEGVST
jgi:hypothetical protein